MFFREEFLWCEIESVILSLFFIINKVARDMLSVNSLVEVIIFLIFKRLINQPIN